MIAACEAGASSRLGFVENAAQDGRMLYERVLGRRMYRTPAPLA
jgi:hypothetical protein